jgi:recombinational DNA repair protein (RecF pathway)
MAYKTYTTEAIVCGSYNSNTADRSYLLFTEVAGMLYASARSVREERSKQRFALQDFSLVRVSLVKGKTGWRIGSVESLINPFLASSSRLERAVLRQIVLLLRRYVRGEEVVASVYLDTVAIWQSITSVNAEHLSALQALYELRLLSTLGYVAPPPSLALLISEDSITELLPQCTKTEQATIQTLVAQAAEASHL